MKLQLHISRKNTTRHFERGEEIIFAIIDLDRSQHYPENFVCILPRLRPNAKSSNVYQRIFGEQNLPLAKKLLTGAFKSESNPEVKIELQKRIDIISPKPVPQIPCRLCGNNFTPKRTKYKKYQQKTCPTCKTKATTA